MKGECGGKKKRKRRKKKENTINANRDVERERINRKRKDILYMEYKEGIFDCTEIEAKKQKRKINFPVDDVALCNEPKSNRLYSRQSKLIPVRIYF